MTETISLHAYLKELDALLDNDSPTEVVSHCRYILQHFPKNVAAYRTLGRALLQKGQNESQPALLDEAAEIFRRVLSAHPDDFVAHLGLGEVAQYQGRLDEAVWYYERAAEQAPENAVLRDTIRQLDAKRGAAPAPEVKRPLSRAALVRQYMKAGNIDQALTEVRAVLADDPDRLDLRVLEAEALWDGGHWAEAGEAAAQILRDHPDCLPANRILAELWLMYKRPADAQPFLNRLEALDPVTAARVVGGPDAVPDGITLPRLDYTAKAAASLTAETPDWVQELGEGDRLQDPFAAPVEAQPLQAEPPAEAPVGEVPDWAAVFAAPLEDLPADDDRPSDDEGPALALGIDWSMPLDSEEAYEESPAAPDWYAAPVEPPPFGGSEGVPDAGWASGPTLSDLEPLEMEPPEAQSPVEEAPSDFESFLHDYGARQVGTGALDEGAAPEQPLSTAGDVPPWGEEATSEPAEESGYALGWMADLGAPASVEEDGIPTAATGDAPAEPDFGQDEPAVEDAWLSRLNAEVAEADQDDEGPDTDDAWLTALETRGGDAPVEEAGPHEDEDLSDEDWLARLAPGGQDAGLPNVADRLTPSEAVLGEEEPPLFEASFEEEAPGGDQPAQAEPERPSVTEDELEALRRASMPPPGVDLNELLGIGEAEPDESSARSETLAPDDASDAAPPEPAEAGPVASPMPELSAQDIDWATDDAAQEAAMAEADLRAELEQATALPGDAELDAGLLAFFEAADEPDASAGDEREPGRTALLPGEADEITTDELKWLEEQQPDDDWLGSFSKEEADEAQAEPESWLPGEEAAAEPETTPESPVEDAPASPFSEIAAAEDEGEAGIPEQPFAAWETPVEDRPPYEEATVVVEPGVGASVEDTPFSELIGAGQDVAEAEAAEQPFAVWETPAEDRSAYEEMAVVAEPGTEAPAEDAEVLSFLELIEAGQDVAEAGTAEQAPPAEDRPADEAAAAGPEQETAPEGAGTMPAWLAEMQPAQDLSPLAEEFEALLNGEYDPFEGGRADQVPTYAAAKETGILQPDEQPEWMAAFLDGEADEPAPEDAPAAGFPAVGGGPGPEAPNVAEAADEETPAKGGLPDWLTLDEESEPVQPPVDVAPPEVSDAAPPPAEEQPARSLYTPLPPREPEPAHMPDWLAAIASEGDAGLPGAEDAGDESPSDVMPTDSAAWPGDDAVAYAPEDEPNGEDLAFLQQLDAVDWLPDARQEPSTDELAIKDDLLNDLNLGDLGEAFAPPTAPQEVAQAFDLTDTTSAPAELPPVVDEIPAEAFTFDDELPAWLKRSMEQGNAAQGGTPRPASNLPEWLREPDEDPD